MDHFLEGAIHVAIGTAEAAAVTTVVVADQAAGALADVIMDGLVAEFLPEEDEQVCDIPNPFKPKEDQPVVMAPRWAGRFVWFFQLAFAVALILSSSLALFGCSSTAATPWRSATDVMPQATLQQIVEIHSTGLDIPATAKNMKAWVLPGQGGKLAVLDFRTRSLCGSAGCFYAAYWIPDRATPVEVMSEYWNNRMPPGQSLLLPGEVRAGKPCFTLQQLTDTDGQLLQRLYCAQGGEYQAVQERVVQVPVKK